MFGKKETVGKVMFWFSIAGSKIIGPFKFVYAIKINVNSWTRDYLGSTGTKQLKIIIHAR